jgi:hypothetical protein
MPRDQFNNAGPEPCGRIEFFAAISFQDHLPFVSGISIHLLRVSRAHDGCQEPRRTYRLFARELIHFQFEVLRSSSRRTAGVPEKWPASMRCPRNGDSFRAPSTTRFA